MSPMPYLGNKDQNSDINFDFTKGMPSPSPGRKYSTRNLNSKLTNLQSKVRIREEQAGKEQNDLTPQLKVQFNEIMPLTAAVQKEKQD